MDEAELYALLETEGEDVANFPYVDPAQLSVKYFQDIIESITNDGSSYVVTNQNSFILAAKRASEIRQDVLVESFRAFEKAIKVTNVELNAEDEVVASLSTEQKCSMRKALATISYVFLKIVTEMEKLVKSDMENATVNAGKKKGKKAAIAERSDEYSFWTDWKLKLIKGFNRILSLRVQDIQSGSLNYLRCITVACCIIIKNSSNDLIQEDDLSDEIFTLLGYLYATHGEKSRILSRLIPELRDEQSAVAISRGLAFMSSNCKIESVISESFQEALDVYHGQLAKEASAEKGFATFIKVMIEVAPGKVITTALPFLCSFLESESSTVRSAVLVALYDLIEWIKNHNDEVNERKDNLRQLLTLLLNHVRDVNSLVRNKAIQMATKLVEKKLVGTVQFVLMLREVKSRILDKTQTTRKNAMVFVSQLISTDPTLIKFSPENFREKMKENRDKMTQLLANTATIPNRLIDVVVKEYVSFLDEYEDDDEEDTSNEALYPNLRDPEAALVYITNLTNAGKYWEACECLNIAIEKFNDFPAFKDIMNQAEKIQIFSTFLKSLKTGNDNAQEENSEEDDLGVLESDEIGRKKSLIGFLMCSEKIARMLKEVERMLTSLLELGSHQDKGEVVSFYSDMTHICPEYSPPREIISSMIGSLNDLESAGIEKLCSIFFPNTQRDEELVRKLIQVLNSLNLLQKDNLNVLLQDLVKHGRINSSVIQILWDVLNNGSSDKWKESDSKAAVYILGSVSVCKGGNEKLITSNIDLLIGTGLGPRAFDDIELAAATCEALLITIRSPDEMKKKPESRKSALTATGKAGTETETEPQLPKIMFAPSHEIFNRIEELIKFGLQKKGNKSMKSFARMTDFMIQIVYKMCLEPSKVIERLLKTVAVNYFQTDENEIISEIKGTEKLTYRYTVIMTSILSAHIFYYDNIVQNELKRRNLILQKKGKHNKSMKGRSSAAQSNEANEMDLIIGNIGYDPHGEKIRAFIETILNTGAFRSFRMIIFHLSKKIEDIRLQELKVAIVSALGVVMNVSAEAVQKTITHFISVWNTTKDLHVKCEMIKVSCYLNAHHPNQMEEFNKHVVESLRDPEEKIRIAALDFITFLSLNDFVKSRDQVSEAALCLIDHSQIVKEMAKDFLIQCSEKENTLSNALPDIIAKVSNNNVSQNEFQQVMGFLLELIKKERQIGSLIEKIISRFQTATTTRQYQDIMFCLVQFSYTDKSFKCIQDKFEKYKDKIDDDLVMDGFKHIIDSARKNCKTEFKVKLDEFEKNLVSAHEKCVENHRIAQAAKVKDRRVSRGNVDSTDESDTEISPESKSPNNQDSKPKDRRASRRNLDTSDESDNNSPSESKPSNKAGKLKNSRVSRRKVDSTDDSDMESPESKPVNKQGSKLKTRTDESESDMEKLSENSDDGDDNKLFTDSSD